MKTSSLEGIARKNERDIISIVSRLSSQEISEDLQISINDSKILWQRLYTPKGILHSMNLHYSEGPLFQTTYRYENHPPERPLFTGKMAASYFALNESERKDLEAPLMDLFKEKKFGEFFISELIKQGENFLSLKEVIPTVLGPFKPHYRKEFEIEPWSKIIHSALSYQHRDFNDYFRRSSQGSFYDHIHEIDLKNSKITPDEAKKLLEIFPEEFAKVLRTEFPFMATGFSHFKGGVNRLAGICISGEVDTPYKAELKPEDCVRGGSGYHGPFYIIYYGTYQGKSHAKYDSSKKFDNIAIILLPNELERQEFFNQIRGAYVSGLLGEHVLYESAKKALTYKEFLNNNSQCKELVLRS